MRVIFLADVPGSGLAGEVKEVKNGYARNFLIPGKLAVVATHDQLQRIENIRKAGDERRLKEEQDMNALAELLAQVSVTLIAKAGPTGRFYGAITSAQIADELSRLTEREIEHRNVQLEEPIHEPGSYEAEVRLGHGISVALEVTAEAEGAIREQTVAEAPSQVESEVQGQPVTEVEPEATPVAQAEAVEEAQVQPIAEAEPETGPVAEVDAEVEAVEEAQAEEEEEDA